MNKVKKMIDSRRDITGTEIKLNDILVNKYTNETVIVTNGHNNCGIKGLGVVNPDAGINEWLDVYPDGTFQIIGFLIEA